MQSIHVFFFSFFFFNLYYFFTFIHPLSFITTSPTGIKYFFSIIKSRDRIDCSKIFCQLYTFVAVISSYGFLAIIFFVYSIFLCECSASEHVYVWDSHRERERDTGSEEVKRRARVQFVWQSRHLPAHMDTGDNWPERCLHSPILTTEDGLDKMSSFKWSCGKPWPHSQPAPQTRRGRCEYFENNALCQLLQLKFASQRTTAKCQWSINSNNLGCRI